MKCLVDWTHELSFLQDGISGRVGLVYVSFEGTIPLPALPAKDSVFYIESSIEEEPFEGKITRVDPCAKGGRFYYKISITSNSGLWGDSLDNFFTGLNTHFKQIADDLARYGILSTEAFLFDRQYFDEHIAPRIKIWKR